MDTMYLISAVLTVGLLGYLFAAMRVMQDRSRSRARAVLLASVLYLPLLYGLMLVDHMA